jgi:chromosome segregation ATPase
MTNLSQQLQDQQLSQRNKQLDLREQAVAEREHLLDDATRIKQLEVLDEQIKLKEDIRDNLNAALAKSEKALLAAQKAAEAESEQYDAEGVRRQHSLSKLVSERNRVQEAVEQTNRELRHVKTEIEDSQKYLRVQEAQVNDTIAEWNAQLTELHAEAEHINEEKARLAADILRLKQQRDQDEATTAELHDKLDQLQARYQIKADAYRDELANRRAEIDSLQQVEVQLRKQRQEHDADLQTREQALEVRETALRVKEVELNQREQALRMKLNLVGM